MKLKNIINNEIEKTKDNSIKKLLITEFNNLENCINKYYGLLNIYPTLDNDLKSYYEYMEEKQIIDALLNTRKYMLKDFDKYISEIDNIKKLINSKYPNNEKLNKLINNNINIKLLYKIKNENIYKSQFCYKKINKNIIENFEKDLLNIYYNFLLIFRKYNLDTSILEKNNSIYALINDFEKKINNINAKIELLNNANRNKDEQDNLKFIVLDMKKDVQEESNVLKKIDQNEIMDMNERNKQRRMVRKQEWIMRRNNINKC